MMPIRRGQVYRDDAGKRWRVLGTRSNLFDGSLVEVKPADHVDARHSIITEADTVRTWTPELDAAPKDGRN